VGDDDGTGAVSRRIVVRSAAIAAAAAAVGAVVGREIRRGGGGGTTRAEPSERSRAPSSLNPRDFGAAGDGRALDTTALQRAIDEAAERRSAVVLSPGTYRSGTLHLRSGTTMQLDRGATLLGSTNDADFDAVEPLPYPTYSDAETSDFRHALLAGDNLEGVIIAGDGIIDLNRHQRFGPKPIALRRCRRVVVRGVTIRNAPNYCVSLGGCDDVVVDGITIRNAYADGIDPDCCTRVRISNCDIDSLDDAIVLKTSLILGRRQPTEDVVVTNCVLRSYANCFKLGTESSGDFRNIAMTNCTLLGTPELDAGRTVTDENAGIAIEMVDGATIDGVTVANVSMRDVLSPVFVRLGNRGRGQFPPTTGALRNVRISGVVATGASDTGSITGLSGHPVQHVTIDGLTIAAKGGERVAPSLVVPEQEHDYPQARMFGRLPASGSYVRHGRDIVLRDVHVSIAAPDTRPGLVIDDVDGLDIDGYADDGLSGPAVWLNSVRNATVRGSRLRGGVRITGASTSSVRLVDDALEPAAVSRGADVPAHAVTVAPGS
jgi:polygalacturonase